MTLPFLILAVLTIAGAWAAMSLRGLVHCALALIVAFAGLGALYLNLGAAFIGLAQLLVYVGAVGVLIVFSILLTRGAETKSAPWSLSRFLSPSWIASILTASAIFATLAWATLHSFAVHAPSSPAPQPTVRQTGLVLMSGYLLPLEVIGLMLTAALIGAVILAMKEKQRPE
ncbi:MAG TPA: NADH-quinone oxidoreductase subunit J [Acidobacteriaceae bacterium]|nr:NADH-quinone oxidoreductase subunit J [Acidobacteriaceae bacterium]